MLNWISEHHNLLSLVISFGTLMIWLVYAQLLYLGFRRQRRPRLIINRGKKKDINALCIISNMSAESIFIEYIIATLDTSRGQIVMDVTDFEQQYSDDDELESNEEENRKSRRILNDSNVRENTRQGPLGSGDFLHIGTFNDLIARMARDEGIEMENNRPKGDMTLDRLTIRLVGIYGPEDMPVGAERSFDLKDNGEFCSLTPSSWDTKRMASMRQRRELRKQIQRFNSTNFSVSATFQEQEQEPDDGKPRDAQ
ncbi:hypothetical protein [Modicisalibacter radicis]|uniref:hypothetical protein n=1 Tax=Halomonas sp. EAR18 TaxID=2518972 RepID=UPI00109CB321|nr:hypothetical protein [Halomonas sp. EAR18]